MTIRIHARFNLIFLFAMSLFGCASLKDVASTATAVLSTNTPTEVPTLTPSPTLPPVYFDSPAISAENATKVIDLNAGYRGTVSSLAFSPNGKYLAAAFDNGAGIFWDISTADNWNEWADAPRDIFLSNGQISFSPDSSILATGGTLLEFPSKRVIQKLQGTATFSPINQTLALFDSDNISLWNLDGTQWVMNHKQTSQSVVNIAFSPDGNLFGEALDLGGDEMVNIWRVSDHTLLYSFPPIEHYHPAHFNMAAYAFFAFSPDNQFIVTGTKDFSYKMRVWNLQTGELVKDLDLFANCIAFSQDTKVIILVDGNRITFRTFPDGDLIRELEVEIYYMSPTDYVTACTTSKDGRLLAIGDSGGTVNIWGVPAYTP
ncbi:MAG: WD40 repeat domain-containing protein [Chloroflexota bacterium]